jgi:hypothetical protein
VAESEERIGCLAANIGEIFVGIAWLGARSETENLKKMQCLRKAAWRLLK